MEETTIIIGTLVFIMRFLTGFPIRDKCCGETDTVNTAINNAILLDADVNREIAKINEDTSERTITKNNILKKLYYGINKTAEKGAMKFYPNDALNELIDKYFNKQELGNIFNSAGYKIEFKYPLTRSDISYISWKD